MTCACVLCVQARLDTGEVLDTLVYDHDFIHLAGQAGVNLHRDLLAVLAVRAQRISTFECLHGQAWICVK